MVTHVQSCNAMTFSLNKNPKMQQHARQEDGLLSIERCDTMEDIELSTGTVK